MIADAKESPHTASSSIPITIISTTITQEEEHHQQQHHHVEFAEEPIDQVPRRRRKSRHTLRNLDKAVKAVLTTFLGTSTRSRSRSARRGNRRPSVAHLFVDEDSPNAVSPTLEAHQQLTPTSPKSSLEVQRLPSPHPDAKPMIPETSRTSRLSEDSFVTASATLHTPPASPRMRSVSPPSTQSAQTSSAANANGGMSLLMGGEKWRPAYSSLIPTFDGIFDEGGDDAGSGDIFADLTLDESGMRAGVTSKFLDEYTREGLFEGFASMAKGLRKAGYSNIVFQMDVSDPFVHRSTLSDVKLLTKSKPFTSLTSSANACVIELDTNPTTGKVSFGAVAPHPKFEVSDSNFLMDVFVRRKKMQSHDIKGYQDLVQNSIEWTQDTTPILPITSPPSPTFRPVARPTPPSTPTQRRFHLSLPAARRVREFLDTQFPAPCNTTIIEWTCMQNPLATFKRPPLPGQKFPGLGCGKEFLAAVVHLASVRRRDAVATVPDHFHNAWMYGKSGYEFVSPAFAGYFMAIMDDLKDDIRKHGIAAISWAFHNGHVVDKEGVVEVWQPQDQMTPISRRMRAYFRSHGYKHLVEEFRETFKGRLSVKWEDAVELKGYLVEGGEV